ncbi:DUF418 domain-containing protein [Parabacteroides sp. AM08-6]|uniref:DUF418 domain-containing protein n=1 Tax=Parabacteroides sp. AM08-6 TaxID=2292053 RepID=UPI000F0022C4|nr:DUF418 domain-containing protein [Parabacteroides sp. AM08-6]RHJ83215.1 DUF418 domain-containing protein [Parabacteroides sp. AM08-6]
MEQGKLLSDPQHRITLIDALRGFALLGIVLIHMMHHYSVFSISGMGMRLFQFPALDSAIRWFAYNVIMGRFINIFAFLFGMSFFIQMDRAAKKGIDFRMRFLWRMAILFAIGFIGNCFYTDDILSIYALFGVVMVFLYRFKNWVLIAIIALLLLGAPRWVMLGYERFTHTELVKEAQARQTAEMNSFFKNMRTQKPSFCQSVKGNLTSGLRTKLNVQFGVFGRGYLTLALFVMGLIVGRLRFFEEVRTRKKRNLFLFVGFILATFAVKWLIAFLLSLSVISIGLRGMSLSPAMLAVMSLSDIYMVLFSGALVMGFIVLYQFRGMGKYLDVMSPLGRMGLTNYEIQSVIGPIFFSMWGFGSIFGNWGATETFLLGLIVYTIQIFFSKYWLKNYLYGPLEWLWRSATYLKRQPFKRNI